MAGRTIAIGDIHGCLDALEALVAAIEPDVDDVVVPLGDFVDRGPHSRMVVDLLMSLGDYCRLVPLRGNHEEMLLNAVRGGDPSEQLDYWLPVGGKATLASYGGSLAGIPPQHVAFIEYARFYYETPTHVLTHANYQPDLPFHAQPRTALQWDSLRDRVPGPHVSGKRVVVGHTSQKSGKVLDLGHLVCLDTYCYGGGWLSALEVDTNRLWQFDAAGRPNPELPG